MSTTNYTRQQCDVCGREQDFPQGKSGYGALTMEVRGPRLQPKVDEYADLCSLACAEKWMAAVVKKVTAKLAPPSPPPIVVAPKGYAKAERA
ncbi:MAG: hypothetical protein IVW53_10125 [Chloroflexi bacterium]|nr:hypothetical protein [Chloroflexota bacterium]